MLEKVVFGRADSTATAKKVCARWDDLLLMWGLLGTLPISRSIKLI
jgi:hypothetical protein